MDCLRLEKVVLFGEYLCGIEPPMLSFDVEKARYFSVAPAPVKSEERLADPDRETAAEVSGFMRNNSNNGDDDDGDDDDDDDNNISVSRVFFLITRKIFIFSSS